MVKTAWVNVLIGATLYFFLFGLPASLMPSLYPAIIQDTGWPRTVVMSFATFKFSGNMVAGLSVGFLAGRFDNRWTLLLAAFLVAFSLMAFQFISQTLHYYFLGFALGFASISVTLVVKTIVSQSFARDQGKALGLTLLGAGIGATLSPLIAELLNSNLGWKQAVSVYGYLNLAVATLLVPFVCKSGFTQYNGDANLFNPVEPRRPFNTPLAPSEGTLFRAFCSRGFLLVTAAVFFTGFSDQALFQLTKIYLQLDVGFTGLQAASTLSSIILISLGSRVLFGWFYDRFSLYAVFFCLLLTSLGSLSALAVVGPVSLAVFVLLRGLGHGGRVILVPVLTKHLFGDRYFPQLLGMLTASYSLGMATGPLFAGLLFDWQGSYTPVFLVCALIPVLGIAALGLVGQSRHS